jgi:hypothetical protein
MVNAGKAEARVLEDRWTAVTQDGSFSAHFEHCVAITADGPVILTQSALRFTPCAFRFVFWRRAYSVRRKANEKLETRNEKLE